MLMRSNTVDAGCTVADLHSLIRGGRKFSVIYADPPWAFRVYAKSDKAHGAAEAHYPVMGLDDIKSLPVIDLALPDSALLLWSVWPNLPAALDVIAAWGFEFKTVGFVWVKTRRTDPGAPLHTGMGFWTRANTEPCLLATRGSPRRLAKNVHQVIMSPVGSHSRKPEQTHVRIERLLEGPYLELFGRRPMEGWAVWGNQITRGLFHTHIPELHYDDTR